MYPGDIAARLQLIESGVSPVAAVSAVSAVAPDAAATAGQNRTAQVVQKLADGTYEALIGGRSQRLALPPQTEAGQTVTVQQLADGRYVAAGSGGEAASETNMSETARLVDLLLQAAPKAAPAPEDLPPLLPAAPAATAVAALPATLANALARALGASGLFYESHLQQWNAGLRNLPTILGEPQARLDLTQAAPGKVLPTPEFADSVPQGQTGTAAMAGVDPPGAGAASILQAGVHPASVPVVAQQLSVLETGQITWRGELWPGQSLFWQIARDGGAEHAGEYDEGATGANDAPQWRTRLAVSFPGMGIVTAQLALRGNSLWVSVAAAESATQQKLDAAGANLGGALAHAGLQLQQLKIDNERVQST
jgi:hypothetical protein